MNHLAKVFARVAPAAGRSRALLLGRMAASIVTVAPRRTRSAAPLFNRWSPQRQQLALPVEQLRCFSSDGDVITVDVPQMGDSIEEGSIVEWVVNPGEWVHVDDVIVLVETDKVTIEVRADNAGKVVALHAEVDDSVDVGSALYDLELGTPPEGISATPVPPEEAEASAPAAPAETTAAPAAPAAPAAAPTPPPPAQSQPVAAAGVDDADASTLASHRVEERVKMTRMRKTIANNLKHAQNTAAMLTTFNEVDMSALIEMRKTHQEDFMKAHGGQKLGFMSPFMKACALALQEVPAVNSQLTEDDHIVYRNYADISVAVATPTGLLMPVVRDCQSASLADLEGSLGDLAARARSREIAMEEMQGGTFSISNGGIFGSMMGTPILFSPQTAILGMHGTKMRAVVDPKTGEVVARPMMYLALTYDHRLIDGREASTFLVSVKNKIEDPRRMLLGL